MRSHPAIVRLCRFIGRLLPSPASGSAIGTTDGNGLTLWLSHPGIGLLARIALVSAFLLSGVLKALDFSGAMGEVRGLTGLEPAGLLAVLVIATQLGGSILVIAGGRAVWVGAFLLAGFTAIATLLAHAFWTKSGVEQVRDLTTFFEHAGLVGGFLLASILVARSKADR